MHSTRKNEPAPFLARRWRAALAHAGVNQEEWAKRNNWTAAHVSQVVAGKRESEHVTEKVLAFIREQEHAIAARVVAAPETRS